MGSIGTYGGNTKLAFALRVYDIESGAENGQIFVPKTKKGEREEMNSLSACRMYGEYEDGSIVFAQGNTEDECMDELICGTDAHGELIFYTGVCND